MSYAIVNRNCDNWIIPLYGNDYSSNLDLSLEAVGALAQHFHIRLPNGWLNSWVEVDGLMAMKEGIATPRAVPPNISMNGFEHDSGLSVNEWLWDKYSIAIPNGHEAVLVYGSLVIVPSKYATRCLDLSVRTVNGIWDYNTLGTIAILYSKIVLSPNNSFPKLYTLPNVVVKEILFREERLFATDYIIDCLRNKVPVPEIEAFAHTEAPYVDIKDCPFDLGIRLYTYDTSSQEGIASLVAAIKDKIVELYAESIYQVELLEYCREALSPPHNIPTVVNNRLRLVPLEFARYRHAVTTDDFRQTQQEISILTLSCIEMGFLFVMNEVSAQ